MNGYLNQLLQTNVEYPYPPVQNVAWMMNRAKEIGVAEVVLSPEEEVELCILLEDVLPGKSTWDAHQLMLSVVEKHRHTKPNA